jgi:hypothetical protein
MLWQWEQGIWAMGSAPLCIGHAGTQLSTPMMQLTGYRKTLEGASVSMEFHDMQVWVNRHL